MAEDLLQTALAKSWFAWGRLDEDPERYVRKILVNTYASWWRRRWRGETPTESTFTFTPTSWNFLVAGACAFDKNMPGSHMVNYEVNGHLFMAGSCSRGLSTDGPVTVTVHRSALQRPGVAGSGARGQLSAVAQSQERRGQSRTTRWWTNRACCPGAFDRLTPAWR